MNTPHTELLIKRMTAFLNRRTALKSFSADDQIKADQLSAYLKILLNYAPVGAPFYEWWNCFSQDLGVRVSTWSWPTEAEVLASAQEASKKCKPAAEESKRDALAIALRRMETGEPLCVHWLWGANAIKLIGRIGEARVQERRDRYATHLVHLYGFEEARNRILELEKRHQEAVEAAVSPYRSCTRRMPKVVIKSVRDLLGPGPEYIASHAEDVDAPPVKSSVLA